MTPSNQHSVLFHLMDQPAPLKPDLKCEADRFLPVEHDCAFCGKTSFNMKACTRCWWAKYCGQTCQQNHWNHHKRECRADAQRNSFYKGGRIVEMAMLPSDDHLDPSVDENALSPGTDSFEAYINEDAIFLDLDKCPKNGYNDHADFIAVKEFSIKNLPAEIRLACVADYILAESKTTVRVLVKWTSKNRPDQDSCARFRGTRNTRTASGKYVLDNPHDIQTKDCPIPLCHRKRDLGPNHKIYEGDLKIFTNKHVLYDEDELNRTVVDFFYDSHDRKGVAREYATKLFYTKPSSDKTFLKVTIHDADLLQKLEQIDTNKCQCFQKLPPSVLRRMSAFAIVISHPHGLPKKVSIGRVVKVTEENLTDETIANAKSAADLERIWFVSRREEDYRNFMAGLGKFNLPVYKVWYDTPTCQGSSGAPVIFGARQCNGIWGPYMAFHSAYDVDSKLNYFKVVRFMD
ncbi:unnamed protein product [Lymnaea stagnalis]|uniref:MYND-type domain-containing protein n=1 Tax=Lymnaea stagnalis TaxID=6523 RepID=A0AAV2IBJ1_LYMST